MANDYQLDITMIITILQPLCQIVAEAVTWDDDRGCAEGGRQ